MAKLSKRARAIREKIEPPDLPSYLIHAANENGVSFSMTGAAVEQVNCVLPLSFSVGFPSRFPDWSFPFSSVAKVPVVSFLS